MPGIDSWAWMLALVACALYCVSQFVLRARRKCFNDFEGTGIPGPPIQSLIHGNTDEFLKPTQIESLDRWLKQYGDVFGFFLGDAPIVVVKDLDIIKEVFTKDFSNFSGRAHTMCVYELNPVLNQNLMFCKRTDWKETRACMSQFFTRAKLKTVMPYVVNCQRKFIEILGTLADSGAEVDILTYCGRLTFDVISKMAYGIETDVQRNLDHPLFQAPHKVVPNFMDGFLYSMGQNLFHWPWLLKFLLQLFTLCGGNPISAMHEKAKVVIEFRRKNPQVNLPDMPQILLDDALGRREATSGNRSEAKTRAPLSPATMDKLAGNCRNIFLGGYDTTRLTLTYWFYLMGKHPDIQERMRKEALEAFESEGEYLSVETLTHLSYTNQVISETLRLYPPLISMTARAAEEDRRYGRYLIRKGTSVMVPTYQLHCDPLYWDEPEKFDPDRFSPENRHLINPLAYQPFGLGPRGCIGQRFGLLELASVTTQVLRHFRVTLGPSQKSHLELRTLAVAAVPKDNVWIQVHRLNRAK